MSGALEGTMTLSELMKAIEQKLYNSTANEVLEIMRLLRVGFSEGPVGTPEVPPRFPAELC
jgi:hypothetical protein